MVRGVGQERLGPSYFFISLVLQPLMVRTFLKVYMELGSYFLFLQEQIKDIIIIQPRTARPRLKATRERLAIQAHHAMRSVVVSESGGVQLVPGQDGGVRGRRAACT